MNPSTIALVLVVMVSLMTTLAWVGLRFFCPSESPAPRLPRLALPQWNLTPWMILAPFRNPQLAWFGVALLLMGTTVAVTLSFSRFHHLAEQQTTVGPLAEVVKRFNLEPLVQPQSLPPTVFLGTDQSLDLEHADRDWNRLDPDFRNAVFHLFGNMEARGYRMALLEGYRSQERQEMLFQKGLNVTQVKQSKHRYGFAVDIAPVQGGRVVISEQDPWAMQAYQVLGEEAAKIGLEWGGSWRMKDLGHIAHPDDVAALSRKAKA